MPINYEKNKYKDTTFGGTQGIVLPSGNTSQRGTPVAGQMRYNTQTELVEQYTGTGANAGWKGIDAPPTITNVSGVIREDTDVVITVAGSNFGPGSIVSIEGAGVNGIARQLSTTFVSSAELTANTNASSLNYVGGASYNVKVTNASGLSAILEPAGLIDRDVVWSTSAGSIGTFTDRELTPGATTYTYTGGATEYQVIKFLAPGDHTWTAPFSGQVDVLVVGGGGSAGANNGGGGGAGGLIYQTGVNVTSGTNYSITVGAGAPTMSTSGGSGYQGENSSAFGYTAIGGGGGTGGNANLGTSGGSGGGDGRGRNGGPHAGTSGQGFAGGSSSGADGGGGGGAGEAGNTDGQCAGGDGLQYDIDGTSKFYAGGGAGGSESGSNNGRPGGAGGGGIGGDMAGISGRREGREGRHGLGGGGGGDTNSDMMSGGGGHGTVIIRYPVANGKPTRFTLNAGDPDGTPTTYSVISGSLPSGLELNSATGEIKGYTPPTSSQTTSAFTVRATSNNVSVDRNFSITVNPMPSRFLVCAISDSAGGGTVASPNVVTYDQMSTSAGGLTHVNWESFPYWNSWTRVCFTSLNKPWVQWRFERTDRIESIVKTFMSPYSQWTNYGISNNGTYQVFPTVGSSIEVGAGVQGLSGLHFQHNNGGSEPYDILTLGNDGGSVWSTGMYWGQIDAPSNYGGFLNTVFPHIGSPGGNTGDKLLVYLETTHDLNAEYYTNYLTPTGPLGDARNLTWTRNGTGGFGGTPSNVADAISRDTSTDWPVYGYQQTGSNPMWIQVDLGTPVAFDFTFAIGYPGGSHYSRENYLEASNDNSNWTRVAEWTRHNGSQRRYDHGMLLWNSGQNVYGNVVDNSHKWIPVNNATAYRYWRLAGTNFSVTNNYQLVMNWGLLKRNT